MNKKGAIPILLVLFIAIVGFILFATMGSAVLASKLSSGPWPWIILFAVFFIVIFGGKRRR